MASGGLIMPLRRSWEECRMDAHSHDRKSEMGMKRERRILITG